MKNPIQATHLKVFRAGRERDLLLTKTIIIPDRGEPTGTVGCDVPRDGNVLGRGVVAVDARSKEH